MKTSEKNRPPLLLVGPSPHAQGGMAACMGTYLKSDLNQKYKLYPVFTRTEGSKWLKLRMAIEATFRFLWISVTRQVRLCHIHFCSDLSFYRKSWFMLLAKILNQKIIGHSHGGRFYEFFVESGRWAQRYIRKILNSLDLIITGSGFAKSNLAKVCARDDIQVIYNSVSDPQILKLAQDSSKKILKNIPKILFLGRIEEPKGVYDLLKAASLVRKKFPQAKFYLGGAGEIEKAQSYCRELNLNGEIEFLGWIEKKQKTDLLREATLFVLPTHFEIGPCVAILEAMAVGLPIVTCDVSGMSEAVEDAVNGFLVPKGDANMLADRILRLLRDKNLREEIRANNLKKYRTKFAISNMVKNFSMDYDWLLVERRNRNLEYVNMQRKINFRH
jgi:glycosyltransferase involved in cell wall biosynthesis